MKRNVFLSLISVYSKAILIIFALQSCESMIEVDLPDNKINREDVYKELSTAKAALTYLYSKVRDSPFLTKGNNGMGYNLSLYTDELDYHGSSINEFYLNSIEASSNTPALWWNNAYTDIYAINAFIEGMENSEYITEADKKPLLGEAYTLRALYYHFLVQLFGDVPFVATTDYKINTTINKISASEVLIKVEKDLLKAIDLLDYSFRSPERFFINKTVTELLLSQNYMLQNQWEKAAFYSQKIIDNPLYHLEEDIDKVFKKEAKSTLWQISPNQNTAITPEASVYLFASITPMAVAVSAPLLDLYSENDLRLQRWIRKTTVNNQDFYQVYKYKNNADNTDEYSVFYRLEEAYFTLSLALTMQNKTTEAVAVLNVIRQKRGMDNLAADIDKESFIEVYLQESAKEFFTENGKRFFDLKLTGKLNNLTTVKPNWKEFHRLLPIPDKQLLINKNLEPNNPGY